MVHSIRMSIGSVPLNVKINYIEIWPLATRHLTSLYPFKAIDIKANSNSVREGFGIINNIIILSEHHNPFPASLGLSTLVLSSKTAWWRRRWNMGPYPDNPLFMSLKLSCRMWHLMVVEWVQRGVQSSTLVEVSALIIWLCPHHFVFVKILKAR